MSPALFAGTGRRHHYDFEGLEPTAVPPTGYLWTQVMASGLSLRNYGFFVENVPLDKVAAGGNHVDSVRDAALAAVTNLRFRGYDPDLPDTDRAKVFLADLAQFDSAGNLPRFLMLRMSGEGPSADLALGSIVEALSRSRSWPKMAVFLLQESGNGPAFVLSPYTRRGGTVDSTFYNTTSLLRTIELILGLRPMTLFDAASPPMSTAFSLTPDPNAFSAEKR
jgi:hypothetical protein